MKTTAALIGASIWLMATAVHGQEQPSSNSAPPATLQRVTGSGDPSASTPIPDPTKLTTEAVDRLKEQLTTLFTQRLENIERDLVRLHTELEKRPESILVDEKFKGVNEQFAGRDVALAAALLAQKTSVADQNSSNLIAADKAEKSFIEQIRGIQALLGQQDKAATDKIDDVKSRLQSIEGRSEGSGSAINWIIAAAGFVSVVLGIAATLFALFKPSSSPAPVVQYNEEFRTPARRR